MNHTISLTFMLTGTQPPGIRGLPSCKALAAGPAMVDSSLAANWGPLKFRVQVVWAAAWGDTAAMLLLCVMQLYFHWTVS